MSERRCHYCSGPIPDEEKAVRAKTGNAWAHFECWYDGSPFRRDPGSGEPLPVVDGPPDMG
jgi:hypothetical protein